MNGGGGGGDDGNGPAESDDAAASVPLAAEVRLAGVENKEKMYEPKHNRKLVRVLTVVAYVFSVSLAAIMLSLYYVFLWKPPNAAQQQLLYNQYYNRALSHSPPLPIPVPTPATHVSKNRISMTVSSPQTTWKNVISRMNQFYSSSSTTSLDDITDTTETLPPDLLDAEYGVSLRASQIPDQESTLSSSSEVGAAHSPPSLPSPPSPLPQPPSSASSFAGSDPNLLHQIVMGRRPIDSTPHHLRSTRFRGRDRNDIAAGTLNRFGSILPLRGT